MEYPDVVGLLVNEYQHNDNKIYEKWLVFHTYDIILQEVIRCENFLFSAFFLSSF